MNRRFSTWDMPRQPIQLWKDVSLQQQPVLISALNRCQKSHVSFKNSENVVNKLCQKVEHMFRKQEETIQQLMKEGSPDMALKYLLNAVEETKKLETEVKQLFQMLEDSSWEFTSGVQLLRESAHCAKAAAYDALVKNEHEIAMAECSREEAFQKTQESGMSWAKGILHSATIFSVQTWNLTGAQEQRKRQEEQLKSIKLTKRNFLDPMRTLAESMTRVSETWAKVGRMVKKVNLDYTRVVRPLITRLADGRDPEIHVSQFQVQMLQEDLQRVLDSVHDFQQLTSEPSSQQLGDDYDKK
eukprot:GEMP01064019.1.p1 GENE.GEMP01064019.1~~GEMP01064019.1.p1  ORF type:complete len:299 (+),score=68.08 GEMP01064019.1:98-994(+)